MPNSSICSFICWFNLFSSFFTKSIDRGEKYLITILQVKKKKDADIRLRAAGENWDVDDPRRKGKCDWVMFIWPILFWIVMEAAAVVESFMHVTGIHQRIFSAPCVIMNMISYPHPTVEFLLGLWLQQIRSPDLWLYFIDKEWSFCVASTLKVFLTVFFYLKFLFP